MIATCRLHREDGGWVQTDLRALQCPWHGWSFPLAIDDATNDGLARYPVRIEGDDVQIGLPPVTESAGSRW